LAAWHANHALCKRLIDHYAADPRLLTSDGRRASELAACKDQELAGMLLAAEADAELKRPCVRVTLLKANGECILASSSNLPSTRIDTLRDMATDELRKCGAHRFIEVSALVTASGESLRDEATLEESMLAQDSVITAIIVDHLEELEKLEAVFHNFIMERAGRNRMREALIERGFDFPSLKNHLEENGLNVEVFYPVAEVGGGFNTKLCRYRSEWKLICEELCRFVGGPVPTFQITVAGVQPVQTA